eukprot:5287253-Prymnesium_polylepis.1
MAAPASAHASSAPIAPAYAASPSALAHPVGATHVPSTHHQPACRPVDLCSRGLQLSALPQTRVRPPQRPAFRTCASLLVAATAAVDPLESRTLCRAPLPRVRPAPADRRRRIDAPRECWGHVLSSSFSMSLTRKVCGDG